MKKLIPLALATLSVALSASAQETKPAAPNNKGGIAPEGAAKRRVALPKPALYLYGYSDNILVMPEYKHLRPVLLECLETFNIIEGTTDDAELVKRLRRQGKVFAYHAFNPIRFPKYANITADEVVRQWAAPFEATLGGTLPGGFDAISIDEFGQSLDKPELETKQCQALKRLRELYPDRLILVASPSSMVQIGPKGHAYFKRGQYAGAKPRLELVQCVARYADLYLHEWFPHPKNPMLWEFSRTAAANLKDICPEILPKTINMVGTAAFYDITPNSGFCNFLDYMLHDIKNDPNWQGDAGIGIYAFFRTKPDTMRQFNKLMDHYFVQNHKTFFRDGVFKNRISNPSFETELTDWSVESGKTNVSRTLYSEAKIQDWHYAKDTSHEKFCLSMTKGAAGASNVVSQKVKVEPDTTYRLSAYLYSGVDAVTGKVGGELKVVGH
jgi:hypothetical protein